MIEHVLKYAALGWKLLPIWWVLPDGSCACADHHCTSPGKHPITRHGLQDATDDVLQLRAWWSEWPDANIAAAMQASGLIAYDCDLYHNDLEKLTTLENTLGQLPESLVQLSGSQEGYHFIYKSTNCPVRGVHGGVVVRSQAYILLAPSIHVKGQYHWEVSPDQAEIAELPDSWKEALRKTATVGTVGIPDDEPEWLAEVPQEQRIEDMKAHLEREPGEIKGVSLPGHTFNVIRTAVRRYGVHNSEAALLAAQEIYDPKCQPPWGDRLGRLVWSAYERATNPPWGEHYKPDSEYLDEIGFEAETQIAKKPEKKISHDELVSALESARDKLKRSTNPTKKREGKLLARVLKHQSLTEHPDDDHVEALRATLRALAKWSPSGTKDLAIAQVLAETPSCASLSTDQLLVFVSKYRAAVPPKDAAAQSELPPPADDEELRGQLIGSREEGTVKSCGSNIERILRYSTELKGNIRFNNLTKDIEVWEGRFAETSKGVLDTAIANWLGPQWNLFTSREAVGEQLTFVAREGNNYNPVEEYLRGLKWDRVPRIDKWLHDYCGADDTYYNQRVGSMWLISACARGISPGCKVDSVLVLEGGQGSRKSTSLSILGGDWFSGTPLVLGDKDSYMVAGSTWIIELAELSSLRAGEVESHKAFLTSAVDTFRPPYGKVLEKFPRYCVFGGTTNEHEYLQDATGNRRYWACRVGETIDTAKLREDRDQLWAEAVYRYLSAEINPHLADMDAPGERWWFTPEESLDASTAIASRKAEDPWVGMIRDWVGRQSRPGPGTTAARYKFTLADVAKHALELSPMDMSKQVKHITRALREAGFESSDVGDQRFWMKKGTVVHEAQGVAVEPQSESPAPPEPPDSN